MFPVDVIDIIVEYAFEYVLLDWIDEKKLDWEWLSLNEKMILKTNYYSLLIIKDVSY
jgi:hypothetical protein